MDFNERERVIMSKALEKYRKYLVGTAKSYEEADSEEFNRDTIYFLNEEIKEVDALIQKVRNDSDPIVQVYKKLKGYIPEIQNIFEKYQFEIVTSDLIERLKDDILQTLRKVYGDDKPINFDIRMIPIVGTLDLIPLNIVTLFILVGLPVDAIPKKEWNKTYFFWKEKGIQFKLVEADDKKVWEVSPIDYHPQLKMERGDI